MDRPLTHEEVASTAFFAWVLLVWGAGALGARFGLTLRRLGALGDLLALIRPMYHASFLFVLVGAIYGEAPLAAPVLPGLVRLYLAFNVLLYGAIYTFNAITDRAQDAAHPGKRDRPVASGRVPVPVAWGIVVVGIVGAFALAGTTLPRPILGAFAGFLAINAAYSLFFRGVAWLDVLVSGATYPLRVWMGAQLVGVDLPVGPVLAGWLLGIGMASGRRLLEARRLGWLNHAGYSVAALDRLHLAAMAGVPAVFFATTPAYAWLNARLVVYGAIFAYAIRPVTWASRALLVGLVLVVHAVAVPLATRAGNAFFVSDSVVVVLSVVLLTAFGRPMLERAFDRTFTV